jgi:hypothetical protein
MFGRTVAPKYALRITSPVTLKVVTPNSTISVLKLTATIIVSSMTGRPIVIVKIIVLILSTLKDVRGLQITMQILEHGFMNISVIRAWPKRVATVII